MTLINQQVPRLKHLWKRKPWEESVQAPAAEQVEETVSDVDEAAAPALETSASQDAEDAVVHETTEEADQSEPSAEEAPALDQETSEEVAADDAGADGSGAESTATDQEAWRNRSRHRSIRSLA